MPEPDTLIFDVDGTLADTERDGHRPAFNAAFRDAGLDWEWTPEIYGELLSVTGGKERIRFFLEHFHPGMPEVEDVDAFIAGLHRAKTKHYTRFLAEGRIPLRTGVRRLIGEARAAGWRLAIATTTTPANVTALLEHSLAPGSESWFEVIGAGDVVPAKKPAPDIFTHVMQSMGVEPGECIAFEDSAHGLRSARDAGIGCVLVTVNGYTRGQDFAGACLVLDHLGEADRPCEVLDPGCLGDERPRLVDLDLLRRLKAACGE